MDDLSKQVGARIRKRREELGLTRDELAEKSSLSIQFMAKVETGQSRMSTTSLYNVARALNLSADYILFGSDEKPTDSEVEDLLASLTKRDKELAVDILRKFAEAAGR